MDWTGPGELPRRLQRLANEAFLADLNQRDVRLKLSPDGREIVFEGTLRRPAIAALFQRLKPQLLQLLREERA